MPKYVTKIKAINPKDGVLCEWLGPYIEADSFYDAQIYCENNGLGYCEIIGEYIAEIDENLGPFASRLLDDSILN
jgi:hypothetical protein